MTALNEQVGGNHYKKYPIQPWKFCEINKLTGAQTAVIDYVMRHQDKNGKEDLLKARHHIDLMIEHYYPNNQSEPIYPDNLRKINDHCHLCYRWHRKNIIDHPNNEYIICVCDCHKETKGDVPDKEITDTERLDFIENENLSVTAMKVFVCDTYRNTSWSVGKDGDICASKASLRSAIDAAMRGKDGN
jgi:hypothetical protein